MLWEALAAAEPELAAVGERLLDEQHGYAILATVAADGSPRVHPVAPLLTGSGLFVAVTRTSPKLVDLRRDPRVALHSTVRPPADEEFALRGRACEVSDPARRAAVAGVRRSGAELTEALVLFAVDVRAVDWAVWSAGAPRRRRWREPAS